MIFKMVTVYENIYNIYNLYMGEVLTGQEKVEKIVNETVTVMIQIHIM